MCRGARTYPIFVCIITGVYRWREIRCLFSLRLTLSLARSFSFSGSRYRGGAVGGGGGGGTEAKESSKKYPRHGRIYTYTQEVLCSRCCSLSRFYDFFYVFISCLFKTCFRADRTRPGVCAPPPPPPPPLPNTTRQILSALVRINNTQVPIIVIIPSYIIIYHLQGDDFIVAPPRPAIVRTTCVSENNGTFFDFPTLDSPTVKLTFYYYYYVSVHAPEV